MKRVLYVFLGCVGVVLGAIGAVLPMLPAFPFLMLAAFCFARSSRKLDIWFKNTKLYKNNLEDFAAGKGMTRKTKCGRQRHDQKNEMPDYAHCNIFDEHWFSYDGVTGDCYRLHCAGMCMDLPSVIFYFWC